MFDAVSVKKTYNDAKSNPTFVFCYDNGGFPQR